MRRHGEGKSAPAFWHHAYRALLPLLPHGLRARQGDAMLELFDRELRRSEADGARSTWVVGLTGLADLARRGVYERVSEERRALTTANVVILRRTAVAFLMTCAVLTATLVAQSVLKRLAVPVSGRAFEVVLLTIPFTAAMTIPMSVFIAVLWAGSRRPPANLSRAHTGDTSVGDGTLRLAPVVGMASAVALCCLALNAELMPRANLRLQTIYSGQVAVVPTDRSMTIRELRQAAAKLVSEPPAAPTLEADGASLASYEVEIQKKLALAAACVVLALLAAGIASRAQRIRLSAQVVISIVVFGGYYVCMIAGEHLAERSEISPALAMWSANVIAMVLAMITLRAAPGGRAAALRLPPPIT